MAKKKELGLMDIPGIGAATADKLIEAGFTDLISIAVATTGEIVEASGIGEVVARKAINFCRNETDMDFKKGSQVLESRKDIVKISTGSSNIDKLMDGGFESGSIVECFGQYGCLSGDTLIRVSRGEKGHKQRIDWMYRQLHGQESIPKNKRWKLDKVTFVRSFDGQRIGRHPIIDVLYSGIKEVFRLTLDNGYCIKATAEHKIMTHRGWVELQQLTSEDLVMCDTPKVRKNKNVPQYSQVKKIENCGQEKTYDIVCEEPHHNFSANDIIVHNSGKTQIGHVLCVQCIKQTPDSHVFYIDTERTYRAERIIQLAKGAGVDPQKVLDQTYVLKAQNSQHQMFALEKIESMIKNDKLQCRLIIVDSLMAHFRAEYIGRGSLAERQQKIGRFMHKLSRLADLYNLCVYVTNQVMAKPDQFFGDPTNPIGGHIVGHASTFRIYLRPSKKGSRVAKLVDAPNLADGEAAFYVTEEGLVDA